MITLHKRICRAPIIELIRAETVGLDVSMWFMMDTLILMRSSVSGRLVCRARILLDPARRRERPGQRHRPPDLHQCGHPDPAQDNEGHQSWEDDPLCWTSQGDISSAANFANGSVLVHHSIHGLRGRGGSTSPNDPAGSVHMFMTKYDPRSGIRTTHYANLANVGAPTRRHPVPTRWHPETNFLPDQDVRKPARVRAAIGNAGHRCRGTCFASRWQAVDELIRRVQVELPVPLDHLSLFACLELMYFWHCTTLIRTIGCGGFPFKWKVDSRDQVVHIKIRGPSCPNTWRVFGSSNWTGSSSRHAARAQSPLPPASRGPSNGSLLSSCASGTTSGLIGMAHPTRRCSRTWC